MDEIDLNRLLRRTDEMIAKLDRIELKVDRLIECLAAPRVDPRLAALAKTWKKHFPKL